MSALASLWQLLLTVSRICPVILLLRLLFAFVFVWVWVCVCFFSIRSAPECLESGRLLSVASIDTALGELLAAFEDEAQVRTYLVRVFLGGGPRYIYSDQMGDKE